MDIKNISIGLAFATLKLGHVTTLASGHVIAFVDPVCVGAAGTAMLFQPSRSHCWYHYIHINVIKLHIGSLRAEIIRFDYMCGFEDLTWLIESWSGCRSCRPRWWKVNVMEPVLCCVALIAFSFMSVVLICLFTARGCSDNKHVNK